jgi:hypothetical protein
MASTPSMLVHNKSAQCAIEQLELFQPNVTCTQVVKSQSVPHYPINALGAETNVLEFVIQGSGDQYIDLHRTHLYLKCSISDLKDGTVVSIPFADEVCPVPNLFGSMFTQVDVFLNDRMITSSNNLYAYRAYLEGLLFNNKEVIGTNLSAQLFYPDTPNQHDSVTNNAGWTLRKFNTNSSTEFEMDGPLNFDLANQGRYLLNNVDVRIRLSRSSDKFCLMDKRAIQNSKLIVHSAILKVQKITLDPGAQIGIETMLRHNNAIYNTLRVEPKQFTIASGNSSFTREHISLGLTPKFAIIGLVATDRIQGDYGKNPFLFNHFNLKRIVLHVDGEDVPVNGINLKFSAAGSGRHHSMEGYMSLLNTLKKYRSNSSSFMYSKSEYESGNLLYGFEIAPEIVPGAFNMVRNTNVRLDLQFASALVENITVLVFFFYDGTIETNANREIFME